MYTVKAMTISDAWFQLIYAIHDQGYIQAEIQRGSFEKQTHRIQFPGAAIYIAFPGQDMIPVIPPGVNVPAPADMEAVTNYYIDKILLDIRGENTLTPRGAPLRARHEG